MFIVVIIGFFILFLVSSYVCGGNMILGFILTIIILALIMFCEVDESKQKATISAPNDENLEKTIYNGLYNDWKKHKKNGNHFVPSEYVEYFERSENSVLSMHDSAWYCWAKARTKEILISKGYQSKDMKCLSEYDDFHKCRIDHSTQSALYEDFNEKYLPLIKFYNETGEFIDSTQNLPSVVTEKQAFSETVLNDFRIDSSGVPKTPTGKKKYFDAVEILNDIRAEYGDSKYNVYYNLLLKLQRTNSKKKAFYEFCKICEKKGILNIVASEQKYQDISVKLAAISNTGNWTCSKCGKTHNGTDIMCDCKTTKYQTIEEQLFKEIEDLLGKEKTDIVKEQYNDWCDRHGRLYALNTLYPRYTIICKAIRKNDLNIIFNSTIEDCPEWYEYLKSRTHIGEEKAAQILFCKFMCDYAPVQEDVMIY